DVSSSFRFVVRRGGSSFISSSVASTCSICSTSILHITSPTAIVSPSSARSSLIVPENEDGTSAVTLSVIISAIGSYFSTWSPTFTNQLLIVLSVTLSPSCSIVIFSTAILTISSLKH